MFFDSRILGDHLPKGTLCFTYDDGPGRSAPSESGPKTVELGAYLQSQGVPATFFAVGKFASRFQEDLSVLKEQGHLVANHTYDHPSLPAFVAKGGDACHQIAETDALIRNAIDSPFTAFRAPYGDWRIRGEVKSNVAIHLNQSPLAAHYVGPIHWDIDAGDVGFWKSGISARDCARAYLAAIEHTGRGIVLMHDSTADIDEIRERNRAIDLAVALVPELRRRGYRFLRLDSIPQVESARRVHSTWTLTTFDGFHATVDPTSNHVRFSHSSDSPDMEIGLIKLNGQYCLLRGSNGLYLSPKSNGEVRADIAFPKEREFFEIHRFDDHVFLKTSSARFLTRGPEDARTLRAGPKTRGKREGFSMGLRMKV